MFSASTKLFPSMPSAVFALTKNVEFFYNFISHYAARESTFLSLSFGHFHLANAKTARLSLNKQPDECIIRSDVNLSNNSMVGETRKPNPRIRESSESRGCGETRRHLQNDRKITIGHRRTRFSFPVNRNDWAVRVLLKTL